ncbi:MAG: HAD family hydrolase [Ruminococcaceae bacterium]|nr:HAD family hydrolase [Oscillospiraceae bacterium]
MKQYTHLIWDFNGTILNDVAYDVRITNHLLEKYGLPLLADEDAYRAVFGFPVIDYYKRLGFDFSKISFSVLADEWMGDYNNQKDQAPLYEGVRKLLLAVRAAKIPQILLSASQKEMLTEQLETLGIAELFDEVIGAGDHHAYGKADLAREWKKRNPEAVPLMIGDTDHDAESAKAMGGDIILLTCGHQSLQTLKKMNPLAIYPRAVDVPISQFFPDFLKGKDGEKYWR